MSAIVISPEVSGALRSGQPVVALETAVITSGLPRIPLGETPLLEYPGLRGEQPVNLEVARMLDRIVREQGAIPAMIGLIEGTLRVGLSDQEIERLASDKQAAKASASNLAGLIQAGKTAGTTVSATLVACGRIGPIRVFATGGIGGVHRGWTTSGDISGDLQQLSRTQTCVVSSGAKSILDLPVTLQRLESLNIPVIGYRTHYFPRFHLLGDQELCVESRLDDVSGVARLCQRHWRDLGQPSGVLLANPIPADEALDPATLEEAISRSEQAAQAQGIIGSALTPWLLDRLNEETGGKSLRANIALLASNAALASELARSMV